MQDASQPERETRAVSNSDLMQGKPEMGRFGQYGGCYVPETLIPACEELAKAFEDAWNDSSFRAEYSTILQCYGGRPTVLTPCDRLSEQLGIRLFLKREDLAHTGSHKLNNVIGQALLAKRMGKTKIVAETGAGQHGVATATACALFDLQCEVFMGEVDVERQALNVFRMELLGTKVHSVASGSRTLKDAVNDALRYWVTNVHDTYYLLGSVMGPHPYPWMVREFQRIVGDEAREQARVYLDGDPDYVVACVGGGSNAAGTFAGFASQTSSKLIGVEPAEGAAIANGKAGVLHGSLSMLLQDDNGQVLEAHSISAGLDYPGVGPEHAQLAASGRATYVTATDEEVLEAFGVLARTEGIIAALESAHAMAWILRAARDGTIASGSSVVMTLSGRGDKDVAQVKALRDARA